MIAAEDPSAAIIDRRSGLRWTKYTPSSDNDRIPKHATPNRAAPVGSETQSAGQNWCQDSSSRVREGHAIPPKMDVAGYYRHLLGHRSTLLDLGIADESTFAMHITSHNVLKDFDTMLTTISGDESVVFSQACREFQYSLEAILYGNYRHAFSSLRLCFELFTASTYFSAHQMKMNLWLAGSDDLNWAALNHPDTGVYSHNFLKAFNPELGGYRTQYMNLAAKVYRECSQYVHGNPGTHEVVAPSIEYDAGKAQSFHDKVATVRLCVLYQFLVRYLPKLGAVEKGNVEQLALEAFGDLPEIQASFGAGN